MSLEGWDAVADVPYKQQLQAEYEGSTWRQREALADALEQVLDAHTPVEREMAEQHAEQLLRRVRRLSAKTEARQQ